VTRDVEITEEHLVLLDWKKGRDLKINILNKPKAYIGRYLYNWTRKYKLLRVRWER
jgi:hypothetical protein